MHFGGGYTVRLSSILKDRWKNLGDRFGLLKHLKNSAFTSRGANSRKSSNPARDPPPPPPANSSKIFRNKSSGSMWPENPRAPPHWDWPCWLAAKPALPRTSYCCRFVSSPKTWRCKQLRVKHQAQHDMKTCSSLLANGTRNFGFKTLGLSIWLNNIVVHDAILLIRSKIFIMNISK